MTAVPRPYTKLTAEQRRLLDEAVAAAEEFRRMEDAVWEKAVAARNAGVPDNQLCDETKLSRATLNRRYGPRSDLDPAAEANTDAIAD